MVDLRGRSGARRTGRLRRRLESRSAGGRPFLGCVVSESLLLAELARRGEVAFSAISEARAPQQFSAQAMMGGSHAYSWDTKQSEFHVHGLGVGREGRSWWIEALCSFGRAPEDRIKARIADYLGMRPSGVRVRRSETFRPYGTAGDPWAHAALISRGELGTFGGLANDLQSSLAVAISNNHVFADSNAGAPGDPIVDVRTGAKVGVLARFVRLLPPPGWNEVDAAAAYVFDGTADSGSWLGRAGTPSPGMRVKKLGARTGLTYGTVASVRVTVNVDYPTLGPCRFRSCFRIVGADGDRKSVV